ncbi:metalloregulator ArsR/SmtB family transcription factor [Kribbella sp. NPDC058245]|uniref:metalloregulator ArsR/SmtB family transcription factor n=1 Tax=Kribbella sp. NPDC058245 TaxID=3346399 RepID=UPI0036F0498B
MQDVPDGVSAAVYDAIFAALTHPTRRQILVTLYFEGGTMAAGDIARMFEHAWPTISRHLLVLEEAGLVTTERHGRNRTYRLAPRRIELAVSWLSWFSQPAHPDRRPQEDTHD